MVQPRRLLIIEVGLSDVLDLRSSEAAAALGLSEADLGSPVGDYDPCWLVASAAHQLGLHGILAPEQPASVRRLRSSSSTSDRTSFPA